MILFTASGVKVLGDTTSLFLTKGGLFSIRELPGLVNEKLLDHHGCLGIRLDGYWKDCSVQVPSINTN